MPTRIERVTVHPVGTKLSSELHTAHYRYAQSDDIFVRLELASGVVGWGAAAPKPYITGETQQSASMVLLHHLGPAVVGCDVFDIAAIARRLDRVVRGNQAAKCAIDLALHDARGRVLGVPVHALIGGSLRTRLPGFDLIGYVSPEQAAATAATRAGAGFTDLKVKVGQELQTDLARVAAVREAAPHVRVKLDANQAWNRKQAIAALRAFEQYDIDAVEQPVPVGDTAGLVAVRNAASCRVIADEAVQSPRDALELIKAGAVDALNVKIAKVGGLTTALQVAAVAAAAGVDCMAGCTMETSLIDAAAAHFMASTAVVVDHEVKAPLWAEDDAASGLEMREGSVLVPTGPGLGVEVDEYALARLMPDWWRRHGPG